MSYRLPSNEQYLVNSAIYDLEKIELHIKYNSKKIIQIRQDGRLTRDAIRLRKKRHEHVSKDEMLDCNKKTQSKLYLQRYLLLAKGLLKGKRYRQIERDTDNNFFNCKVIKNKYYTGYEFDYQTTTLAKMCRSELKRLGFVDNSFDSGRLNFKSLIFIWSKTNLNIHELKKCGQAMHQLIINANSSQEIVDSSLLKIEDTKDRLKLLKSDQYIDDKIKEIKRSTKQRCANLERKLETLITEHENIIETFNNI